MRAATGLGNATLLRLLATLQDRGWVRRNLSDGQYELAHSLGGLLGEGARAHPLAELAAPILLELRPRELGLPSDLSAVVAPGKVEIVESTRLRGPMAPARTALGIRPSMVLSAHGRALLAFAGAEEVAAHLAAVMATGSRQERKWIEGGQLEAELQRTRARGYGLREPDYFVTRAFDPGPDLGAMAVPIRSASGIHGTLSLLWLRDDMTLDEVLDLGSLDQLRRAAARIGTAMDRAGIAAPRFAGAAGPGG
ncbi:MAG: hypothetical protein D6754_07675 [Alphaproteobacteria bacterium]|nr:MAG: hypothetical protein D6754_07675 [Alphaproteobacteria bacterium]